MSQNKTQPPSTDVRDVIASVEPDWKRVDAERLDTIFRETTGYEPVIWGASIIGYGRYHYVYKSGREGDFLATGFAPRAQNFSIYIMPGYADFGSILNRLGKHKIGKSCLYLNRLLGIDESVLKELISAGLKDLATHWPVHPE